MQELNKAIDDIRSKGELSNGITTRYAVPEDAKRLLEIYAPYVENTAITFEYDVPTLEEFIERIRHTLEKYPYIVALNNGTIVGYAYAGVFHEREAYSRYIDVSTHLLYASLSWNTPAYSRCVETSIYVDNNMKHIGIGGILHKALEDELRKDGFLNMYACIACPKKEDEYLNRNSIEFHSHQGYRLVGEFYDCGYKFKRWYNMVWMEKLIGEHTDK